MRTFSPRVTLTSTVALATALLLTGCTDSDDGGTKPKPPATSAPSAAPMTSPSAVRPTVSPAAPSVPAAPPSAAPTAGPGDDRPAPEESPVRPQGGHHRAP